MRRLRERWTERRPEIPGFAVATVEDGAGDWDDATGEPGTWRYSGEGYMTLQREIESASGMALDVLAETRLFKPLGLERTSYVWHDDWRTRRTATARRRLEVTASASRGPRSAQPVSTLLNARSTARAVRWSTSF